MKSNFEYSGWVQLEKMKILERDSDGNPTKLSEPEVIAPWFHNHITDSGLNQLATATTDRIAFCRIGTGNAAPTDADVNLQAQVGATSSDGAAEESGYSVDASYAYRRVTKQFAAGAVDGVNLAEIAMASAATGDIFSRALIQDASSNPITINLLSDEILNVKYELRLYANLTPVVTNETINGVATTVTITPVRWNPEAGGDPWLPSKIGYYGVNGTTTSNGVVCWAVQENYDDTASTAQLGTRTLATYVPGSFRRDWRIDLSVLQANFTTGIEGLVYGSYNSTERGNQFNHYGVGRFATKFAPKIQKNNEQVAHITVGISWGRYVP